MANAGTYNHTKQHFAEGSAAATPDAGEVVVYAKTDGLLYSKDDAGTETLVSGGSGGGGDITGDDAWVAKGDLIAGTTTDTAGIVTVGSNGSSLRANSGATQGIEWQKNNLAASAAPTADDDTGDGYSVGSRWIDTTADKEYVCLDATSTAAVWTETTQTGGGSSAFVGARASKNGSDQTVANNSLVKITFDATDYDTDSFFDNANDYLTVPAGKAGYYQISGQIGWGASATGRREAILRINGTTYIATADVAPNANETFYTQVNAVWSLAEGDDVELVGVQVSGGNLAARGGDRCWLSIAFLGTA